MLNRVCRQLSAVAALFLAACSPSPQIAVEAFSVEAAYRLMFNDVLVGNSLFVLQIQPDGSYRMEAFTTPAGQMVQTEGHEILESSQGVIAANAVRPQRFEHSIMSGGQIQANSLVFDWDNRLQRRIGEQGEHADALLPGTQDRLSYLLVARQLAVLGKGSEQIQISAAGTTQKTRLQVVGEETIEIPLGKFETVAIRRVTAEPNEIRALWFDTGLSPLPLRVVHGWAGNTVDMQLESLSRQ